MKIPDLNTILVIGLVLAACNSKPKVVEGEPVTTDNANTLEDSMQLKSFHSDPEIEHRVEVKEFQHTEKYTYLHVTEHQDSFWIVIPKREVEVGEKYYYQGGLLTRHFHSQESDQVFETVYLVSEVALLDAKGSPSTETNNTLPSTSHSETEVVKLSDLYEYTHKYEGKRVKVKGTCIKVNPMILGRNWVHIEDGSGENLDLTITTNENISVGAVVSMEGTIALNKDFGSGYRYDIILEGAVLK